jgi:4-diphosphocytidyl-2-C-methyl-D-erythritol kinase
MDGSETTARAASSVIARAPAKLNLTLEVRGRRPDGYHDLASVFQAVSLRDELTARSSSRITLESDRADLAGDDNLVLRAARLVAAEAGPGTGASLVLRKRIPVGAGLGGGSADAAATLLALTRLWRLSLPEGLLSDLAARLGSDVPFFLGGPTALAGGRGEVLTSLRSPAGLPVVIARPAVERVPADKTRRLYAALTPRDYRDGTATAAVAEALSRGDALDPALLVNSFESAAESVFPSISACRDAMLARGADWVRLCGSGPCLYTLFAATEEERATDLARRLQADGIEAYLAVTLSGSSAIDLGQAEMPAPSDH